MGELVDHGDPDLLLELGGIGEVLFEREPEEADLVGAGSPVCLLYTSDAADE